MTTVIVTYNSADLVQNHDGGVPEAPWITTVFVDNDSTDGTADLVQDVYPRARLVRNEENAGFSRAVNLGAEAASSDFILLLNPDAAITATDLASLARYMTDHEDVAISAPIVQDSRAKFATVAAGYAPTIFKMLTHATGLSRLGHRITWLKGHYLFATDLVGHGIQDVDWVSGGCMLIRSDVWRSLGGLSDRWFMYAEDIEFCLRAKSGGYRVTVDLESRAIHEIGQSSKGVDGRVNPAWILNLYELYRWRIARSTAQSAVWKLVVLAGFQARITAYSALSALRGRTLERRADIDRFRIYADALRRAPVSLIRD